MGLKNFFSGGERSKSRVDKLVKTITNPYTQSVERYSAMEKLIEDGSEAALVGIFKRFTMVSTKSIEDEEEKGWAYRQLSGLGEQVLPAARRFCLESDQNVAWALRVIEDVAGESQEWEILGALVEKHPPGYERDPSKKLQILTHIADIDDPRVAEILARYLDDHDEGVRFFAVEQLIDIADESSREPILKRLLHPEEDSLRIRSRILDGLADLEWDVSDRIDELGAILGQGHAYRRGHIVRR